jgi:hypothetical protein
MATETIVIPHKAVKLRKKKPPPAAVHRDRRVYTRKAKHKNKAPDMSGACFFVRRTGGGVAGEASAILAATDGRSAGR